MAGDPPSTRLEPAALRWRCDPARLGFETTDDIEPAREVLAQPTAQDALEFALRTTARGQNVYVRGPRGTGRRTMVRALLARLAAAPVKQHDRCYVNDFCYPDRPRLLTLAAGQGRELRRRMREFGEFVASDLPKALDGEPLASERRALQAQVQAHLTEITRPLEEELARADMRLVHIQQGPVAQTMILPVVEDEPVPPPQLRQLVQAGKAPAEQLQKFEERLPAFQRRFDEIATQVRQIQMQGIEQLRAQTEEAARALLRAMADRIRADISADGLDVFLQEVVDDVVETRMAGGEHLPDPVERYGVNVVLEHEPGSGAPVVEETMPTLSNLLGSVEIGWNWQGPRRPDYSGIRAGALLRADGGFLILDAHDLLTEPGAWHALTRTLRSGRLEIVPPDLPWFRPQALVHPEPIPIAVRVVLIGDGWLHYRLDAFDPDFADLFKTLADFDHEIDRGEEGLRYYASVIAHMCREERLRPVHRTGAAALIEHGARIAAREGKLTARFGRIADLAREASFLAERAGEPHVTGEHVREAVGRTRRRASLPSRKFQELIQARTLRVETSGEVVGQVNGLAIVQSGPILYGFPARITATIGVGRAGPISIEGSSELSGSLHTKGFHILGGLLRHLLRVDHPLAFTASIAFEQSYGTIDGDSASGAEVCCLLSALTGIPIRQSLAFTGAIDQLGHVQAIGGVNEKIEGFFDACVHFGLDGTHGVVIPRANAGDLMLREDVVAACAEGRFAVHAVDTVHEALEILTGRPAGRPGPDGYEPETVLGIAVAEIGRYWRKAAAAPGAVVSSV